MKLRNLARQVLTEARRSQPVSEELAKVFIEKKASRFDPKKHSLIYRGIKNSGEQFFYIQPSKHSRRSMGTSNYYTLIIDNSPKWQKYPERSKSIICGSSESVAADYATGGYKPFIVIPKDGAKVGVATADDLWYSFRKSLDQYGFFDLMVVNRLISKSSQEVLGYIASDKSYSDMVKDMNEMDKNRHIIEKWVNTTVMSEFKSKMIRAYLESGKPMIKFFQDLLDPDKNGFELVTYPAKLPPTREVWTDADSLLVSQESFEKIMKDLGRL